MSDQLDRIEKKLDNLIELLTAKKKRVPTPNEPIEERKNKFIDSVMAFHGEYTKPLLVEFYEYWTEKGPRDRKMKFEKNKSFDINLRLKRWKNNSYNNSNTHSNDLRSDSPKEGLTVFD